MSFLIPEGETWIDLCQALTAPTVATVAGLFAGWKYFEERRRRKLDLVKEINYSLTEILSDNVIDQCRIDRLNACAMDAYEYFGVPVYAKVNELREALVIYTESVNESSVPEGDRRAAKGRLRNAAAGLSLATLEGTSFNLSALWTRVGDPLKHEPFTGIRLRPPGATEEGSGT